MKFGYVLLDGCGDLKTPALNYTTPLEAANTPNMDALARRSRMGSVVTVGDGVAPESDIAVFNMLGYAFPDGYAGRGVVEAVGAGLSFKDGDLALRANFATANRGLIADRRAGRDLTQGEADRLTGVLDEVELKGAEFEFKNTVGYRGVLVIRGDVPLSAEITNTDPAYVRTKGFGAAKEVRGPEKVQRSYPLEKTKGAKRAAELVNEFLSQATRALEGAQVNTERARAGKKKANLILLRDASDHLPIVTPFRERYGMKGVALVEMPAEVGIARMLGMKEVNIPDHKDLEKKAREFNRELAEGTVVYAHIKGPDEFGHDGDAPGKKRNIEAIDEVFFGGVSAKARAARIAVSCDHSTPCIMKMHSSDPVPLMVTAERRDRDCCRFTERDVVRGSLGTLRGADVLKTALSLP